MTKFKLIIFFIVNCDKKRDLPNMCQTNLGPLEHAQFAMRYIIIVEDPQTLEKGKAK